MNKTTLPCLLLTTALAAGLPATTFADDSEALKLATGLHSHTLLTMSSPQTSSRQVAPQPSPSAVFPSSHCSVPELLTAPSPQTSL